MKATSFSYFLKYALLVKLIQTNHYKSVLYNPNHYCQYLTFYHYHQACRNRCISGRRFSPKSNASYFSGGEKRQPQISLCLQVVPNPNYDINKSVGLTQTGRQLGRAKPPVFLFPVLLQCISFFPMQPQPYPPPRGTRGFMVLRY